ncbi:MAG: hypothetical protein LBK95_04425 [Bifidobacteriaceae bacterium]|jgi:hypothetical protein|nr:hypothetical protein [Bifidobacteriaceae bacterium]
MEPSKRLPLWLAVGITVVVGVPFAFWLKAYGLALFVSFTVWAQYFAFGARPAGLKRIIPGYIAGGVGATIVHLFSTWLGVLFGDAKLLADNDIAMLLGYFLGFCGLIFAMRYLKFIGDDPLAFFQGISLTLGCIFTQQGLAYVGDSQNVYVGIIGGLIASILAMLLGCFLGWFNVTLNVGPPKPVEAAAGEKADA